jgi:hypothetical protein
MEVFAKNLNAWVATLIVDPVDQDGFNWSILVEDRRSVPYMTHRIISTVRFNSERETIMDGHAALERLTPSDCVVMH